MTEPTQLNIEPRWPIVVTIAVVFGLTLLPGRVRVAPPWAALVITLVLIAPMAGLWFSSAKQRWLRIERWVTSVFVLYGTVAMLLDLKDLFVKMVTPPNGITGIQLLNSSISLWGSNVLIFAVAYWCVDRGGSVARAERMPIAPDFLFPREEADHELLPSWRPTFADYCTLPSALRRHSRPPRPCP